jgi:hypothetical protein
MMRKARNSLARHLLPVSYTRMNQMPEAEAGEISLGHYSLHLGIKILQNARRRSVLRMDMGAPFGVLSPPP